MAQQEGLREAVNEAVVEGLLSEMKLEAKTSVKDGREYISGDILVEVSPTNIVPVNFFSFKYKKDGNPNRIYVGLENVINTYKSIAQHSREAADKIRITGARIESNEFYSGTVQLIQTFRIRSNFINRVTKDFAPKATFKVELFIQSMVEEINKDNEPTGRLQLIGVIPMYQGRISVVKFFVADETAKNYIQDNYNPQDTVMVAGSFNNEVVEIQKTEEMEFGGDVVDTFTRIKREVIIEKGSKPKDEDDATRFDPADVKAALVQREVDLKEQQERSVATQVTSVSADDVPF